LRLISAFKATKLTLFIAARGDFDDVCFLALTRRQEIERPMTSQR
jgi:hypothetical protein